MGHERMLWPRRRGAVASKAREMIVPLPCAETLPGGLRVALWLPTWSELEDGHQDDQRAGASFLRRELALFSLEKKKLWGDLIEAFWCKRAGERLL